MITDSDRKAAEEYAHKYKCHMQMSCHVDFYLAGIKHERKRVAEGEPDGKWVKWDDLITCDQHSDVTRAFSDIYETIIQGNEELAREYEYKVEANKVVGRRPVKLIKITDGGKRD